MKWHLLPIRLLVVIGICIPVVSVLQTDIGVSEIADRYLELSARKWEGSSRHFDRPRRQDRTQESLRVRQYREEDPI